MAVRDSICVTCGGAFVDAGSGRRRKYCSVRCRQRRPSARARKRRACPKCGTMRIAHRDSSLCMRCARRPTLVPCPQCGGSFWPWANGASHARQFCSTRCARINVGARRGSSRPRTPKPRWIPESRACLWCGATFMAKHKRHKYCCIQHLNIAKRQARKALIRDVGNSLPTIADIYESDRRRCWLCGNLVLLRYKWPDPRTASRDHVIPLADGGRDEPSNIRLAHLGCNIRRRRRILTLF